MRAHAWTEQRREAATSASEEADERPSRRAGRRGRPRRRARPRHRRPDAVDRAARAAGRPHAARPHRRPLRRRRSPGPSPSPPPCARPPCSRSRSGSRVSGRPRAHPAGRPAGAGRGRARSAAAGSGRCCSASWPSSVIGRLVTLPLAAYARGRPAPLRAVHPRAGGCGCATSRSPPAINAGADRAGPAGPRLARPPGAADVVGLGGAGRGGAGRRRVVPLAGGHRAGVQPLRADAGRAAAHRPARAGRARTAPRCRTCWSSDASRRTTALNAYVSGFGSTRRIVVYDTVLEQLPDDRDRVDRRPRARPRRRPTTSSPAR